jgi:hypothetical protein
MKIGYIFFHSCMFLVTIISVAAVISIAIHNNVSGLQLSTMSLTNWLFLYGVSIKIWVQFF